MVRVFSGPHAGIAAEPVPPTWSETGGFNALPENQTTQPVGKEADELWFCTSHHQEGEVTALLSASTTSQVPLLLVGNSDGEVRFFNAASGVVLSMCPSPGIHHPVRRMAMVDRMLLYTWMENSDLYLWSLPPAIFDDACEKHTRGSDQDREQCLPHVVHRVYSDNEITALCPLPARTGMFLDYAQEVGDGSEGGELVWKLGGGIETVLAAGFWDGQIGLLDGMSWR
jgi:hypothetical protein